MLHDPDKYLKVATQGHYHWQRFLSTAEDDKAPWEETAVYCGQERAAEVWYSWPAEREAILIDCY